MKKLTFTTVRTQQHEERTGSRMIDNLKRNWYFPISAMAFFSLSTELTPEFIFGMALAFVIFVVISARIPSIWALAKKQSIAIHLLSIATAAGIRLSGNMLVQFHWTLIEALLPLKLLRPIAYGLPRVTGIFFCIAAFPFVYLCLLLFYKNLSDILRKTRVFKEIKAAEWMVYGLLFAATLGFMAFTFTQSDAFYGTEYLYDVIYTSDSPSLVKGNAYQSLAFEENDFRQALFAVFSAPFTGSLYLVAWLLNASASVRAMLLNSIQIAMMLAANLMLARMLKFDSLKRICFMVLLSCTHTYLLFALMMEQYIVTYFWLILSIYLISENWQLDRIAMWGAGGTLLTSMILMPFMSKKSLIKDFKAWFMDMMKYGIEFVIFVLACCRFDALYNVMRSWSVLSDYTGNAVTFADKLYQYTEFVVNCFAAPNAGASTKMMGHISWQLADVSSVNFVGVVIVLLAIISAIWNRDKKSSLLAAGWVIFSAFILLIFGWGTNENGLILYSLYFGWAFIILLIQLIEKIENQLHSKYMLPITIGIASIVLFTMNFPLIMEMMSFAAANFPV